MSRENELTEHKLFYTGVGSRNTPQPVLRLIRNLATQLGEQFILRSGGADGADSAFEAGADLISAEKEIYLPWKNYNNNSSHLFNQPYGAGAIAKEAYGERWIHLTPAVKKLMTRNVLQVLGEDLQTPSSFVVCWTEDGCESAEERTRNTGGTGQTIAIASMFNIPVFNLANDDAIERMLDHIANILEIDVEM